MTAMTTRLESMNLGRWRRAVGLSPTRSRVLMLLPFLIALLSMGIGYAMMLRYELAVESNLIDDALAWERFQRTNGLLLLALGGSSFLIGVLVVLAVKRALRSVSRDVQRAATGRFDLPLKDVSEREVSQLQGQIGHMLGALNQMLRDSGMGATILVDGCGRVQMINPLVQLLLRVAPEDVLGQPMDRLFARRPQENAELLDILRQSLTRCEPVAQRPIKIAVDHTRQISVRLRTSFLRANDQTQMAVVLVDDDLTQIEDIRAKIERATRFLTLGSLSAHLAHEIRNPLTSISGLVELLRERTPDEQLKQQYIHHILMSTERLNHLIEGLMDFAAVEKCDVTVQPLEPLVRELADSKRHEAAWSCRRLCVECERDLPPVSCNRLWMSRALINLLDNARHATPDDGTVTVRLRRCSGRGLGAIPRPQVELAVHNTGSFIPPERRKAIFEPFETSRPNGTGLGLSIVQEVVRAHGGSITVASDEREGTQFTIRLPAAIPPSAANEAP